MKILITNVFGFENKGDFELFNNLISIIKSSGHTDWEITAVCRNPSTVLLPKVRTVEQLGKVTGQKFSSFRRFVYFSAAFISKYIPSIILLLPRNQSETIKAFSGCDLAIACPGGFLEDSRLSLYAHLAQLALCLFFRKKVVLSPMSIGPVKSKFGKLILAFILSKVSQVFVRESFSYRFCKDELSLKNITLSSDLALDSCNFKKESVSKVESDFICMVPIKWSFPNTVNPSESMEVFYNQFAELAIELASHYGKKIKLVCQVDSDLPAILRVESLLSEHLNVEVYNGDRSPKALKALYSKSFALISCRFHSAIFGITSLCPTISIGYLPKSQFILRDLLLEDHFFPIDNFSKNQVLRRLDSLVTDRSYLERYLKAGNKASDLIENFRVVIKNLGKV